MKNGNKKSKKMSVRCTGFGGRLLLCKNKIADNSNFYCKKCEDLRREAVKQEFLDLEKKEDEL